MKVRNWKFGEMEMEYPEGGRSHLAYLAVSSIYFPSFLTVLVLTFNLLNRDNINFKIDFKHLRKKTCGKKPFHPHRSFRSFHFAKCCAQLQWILLATILDRIDTIASRKTVQHSICQTIGRGITGVRRRKARSWITGGINEIEQETGVEY